MFTDDSTNRWRWVEWPALIAATLAAGWLRFRDLGGPSLWLDEILNVDITAKARALPLTSWLIGFERENGPLYFLQQLAGESLFSDVERSARFFPAVIGTCTVPLFYFVVRAIAGSRRTAFIASLLLAVSPFHVYYSREGRTYALLVLETLLLVMAMHRRRERAGSILFVTAALAAAYTAATAAPIIAAAAIVSAIALLLSADRRSWLVPFGGSLFGLALVALLYGRFDQAPPGTGATETAVMLASVRRAFIFSAVSDAPIDRMEVYALILALAGLVWLLWKKQPEVLPSIGMLLLIVIGTVASLAVMRHWFSARYVIAALPFFLFCVAAGTDALVAAGGVAAEGTRRSVVKSAIAVVLVTPLIVAALPHAASDPFHRAEWEALARTLVWHARDEDTIIASNSWSAESLRFYLRRHGRERKVIDVAENETMARYVARRRARAWIASGGFHRDARIRGWICSEMPIDFDPVEEVIVAYTPGLRDFLQQRASPAERARFFSAFEEVRGGRLEMSRSDADFLDGDWHETEGEEGDAFRWMGKRATAFIPTAGGKRSLHLRASAYREAVRLLVQVGEAAPVTLTLREAAALYSIPVTVREGFAEVILTAESTFVPAVTGDSADDRALSVAVESIGLVREGAESPDGRHDMLFFPDRIGARGERIARSTLVRKSAADVPFSIEDEKRAAMLVRRLGSDPALELPAIRSGQGSFSRLAEFSLAAAGCDSNEAFVERAFRILNDRPADLPGRDGYVRMLRNGLSRPKLLRRMMRAGEFRERNGVGEKKIKN